MKLNIYENKEKLAEGVAQWISHIIEATLQHQEFFTLALSGGNTPRILYKKLSSPEFKEKISWRRVHIFWGDERAVPFNDELNNAAMAYDALIDHISIPAGQVHKMRTDIEPVFSATEYDKILHNYFNNTAKSFDLILLGMGTDGHTLSLFPGSPLIENEKNSWVSAVYKEQQKIYRITLTPAIVNRSENIAFMVTGSDKSGILKQVIEGDYMPATFPAQLIDPENGELNWFLDEAAAMSLKK